jgi:hypothetical protein
MDKTEETLSPSAIVTLFFTYIIPIVPIILVLDGYVSAYRTRSFEHVGPRLYRHFHIVHLPTPSCLDRSNT